MFANYVDGAFFGSLEVAQRVFSVRKSACETYGEERGVVIYDIGVREGSEVCRRA